MPEESPVSSVLVVDDDPATLKAYARALRRAGYEVGTASGGEEALERLPRHLHDVVVCDVMMPDMDGLEFLRRARGIDPDLPVILVTGMPSIGTALAATTEGAYRYFVKPIAMGQLTRSVGEAAKAYRLTLSSAVT